MHIRWFMVDVTMVGLGWIPRFDGVVIYELYALYALFAYFLRLPPHKFESVSINNLPRLES